MVGRVVMLAVVPAVACGFLFPSKLFTQPETHTRRAAPLSMARTGAQARVERVLMRNGLLGKSGFGYQVVEDETDFDGSIDDEVYDLDEGKVFEKSPLFSAPKASDPESDQDENAAVKAAADEVVVFDKGQIIKGVVLEYDSGGALIDIGAKAPGFLPSREAHINPAVKLQDVVHLDTEMEFQVMNDIDDEPGVVLLSLRRIQYEKTWEKLAQMQEKDAVFDGVVTAVNKGGAIVSVEGLRAFLPGSHLSGVYADDSLIGKTLPFKFLELNRETGKLVVSHRRAMVDTQMDSMSRGDVVVGIVKLLKPYGAFVEVNGMSGLLHISQVSYDRVEDLSLVVQPGMQIKCMIIDHDKVNGRIALSTKTLEPEPGDMLKDRAKVFAQAEDTARKYHERMEADKRARQQAAQNIVMGLNEGLGGLDGGFDGLDGFDADPLAGLDAFKMDPLAGIQMEPIFPGGEKK